MEIHVVQPGETLYGIAGQYQADPAILQELNGLPPGGVLAVGQTLVIRHVDTFHTVQPGQTLTGVAALYGISLRQLYRNNFGLGGQSTIQPGQRLVIAYRDAPAGSTHTNGYAYPFISRELLSAQLPYMSFLTPFTYGIDASGRPEDTLATPLPTTTGGKAMARLSCACCWRRHAVWAPPP